MCGPETAENPALLHGTGWVAFPLLYKTSLRSMPSRDEMRGYVNVHATSFHEARQTFSSSGIHDNMRWQFARNTQCPSLTPSSIILMAAGACPWPSATLDILTPCASDNNWTCSDGREMDEGENEHQVGKASIVCLPARNNALPCLAGLSCILQIFYSTVFWSLSLSPSCRYIDDCYSVGVTRRRQCYEAVWSSLSPSPSWVL